MNRFKKGILFLLTATMLIVAGGLIIGYRLAYRALPLTEGVIELAGLSEPVKIHRDEYGVPHIVAQNEIDLAFAVGFVQAQDRLWQMDFLRRVVQGRLSEIFGKKTLDADKALRVVGFSRIAKTLTDSLDISSRRFIEAYTSGVNCFIDSHRDNLPVEFTLLGFVPEPWKVEHSVAVSRLLAWQLSMGWYLDITFSRIADSVGIGKLNELIPLYPKTAPVIVTSSEMRDVEARSERNPGIADIAEVPSALHTWFEAMVSVNEMLSTEPWAVGSNNWVIGPTKSDDGSAILSNDPHLGHGIPPTWYEMHLAGGSFDVMGYALPGLPYIVLGNNRHVAWGFTNVMADETDFYREKIKDSTYFFDGQWNLLKVNHEIIHVKDSASVLLDIPETHHGPLVNSMFKTLKQDDAVSVCWLGNQVSHEADAIHALNIAKSWVELRNAARLFSVPAQNMVFIDQEGNYGYQFLGTTPIRNAGNGTLIMDGTNRYYDWKGVIPFADRPFVLNPEKGFVASANNKVVDEQYPYFISSYFYEPARIDRITQFIQSKEKISVEDSKRLQNDQTNTMVAELIPTIVLACRGDSVMVEESENEAPSNVYQEALLFLKHWDGVSDVRSRGAAVFHAFWMKLVSHLYQDELGEGLYATFANSYICTPATLQLFRFPESSWWDDQRTAGIKENRDGQIRSAFKEGVDFLVHTIGKEPGAWAWGDLHTITFEHPLGKQPPLDHFFNIGPFALGGDGQTPNKATFRITSSKFNTFEGPSMRRIISSSDLGHASSVITVGQSGQLFSTHYSDQVDDWLNGIYRTTSMNSSDWSSYKVLVLNPEKP